MTTQTKPEEQELEYYQAKSVRNAIARELARSIPITPELIAAKIAMDKAISEYRDCVRDSVR